VGPVGRYRRTTSPEVSSGGFSSSSSSVAMAPAAAVKNSKFAKRWKWLLQILALLNASLACMSHCQSTQLTHLTEDQPGLQMQSKASKKIRRKLPCTPPVQSSFQIANLALVAQRTSCKPRIIKYIRTDHSPTWPVQGWTICMMVLTHHGIHGP
jgi:hypothetical protein